MKINRKTILFMLAILSFFTMGAVWAAATGTSTGAGGIGDIADNIRTSFGEIAKLITAAAYVMGFGFVMVAIFKFKQHKDNPQQHPIGGPIAMLFLGIALIFLPTLISTTGTTVFGSAASPGGIEGTYELKGK
jgi:intracellular multiplication protein IcmD